MTRDECIAWILQAEGGVANVSGDPGGHTKYGITQRTLDAVRARVAYNLPANVADLTPNDAAYIYRTVQWVNIRGDDLLVSVAPLVMNTAVNMGEPRAIMLLQSAVGVEADGALGSRTLAAVQGWRSSYMPGQTLAEEYAAHVAVRYAQDNVTEAQFELGWFRRLFRVYTLAVSITTP